MTTCPLTHPTTHAAPDLHPDTYVCPRCAATLRGLLTDLPGLLTDLDIARTRQTRMTDPTPGHATITPLPFALAPADARYVLHDTVLVWLSWITDVRGHPAPTTWAGVGAYLADAVDWLTRHPEGPAAIDELTAGIRNARHAIDRPADRAYAGPCTATIPDPDGLAIECGTDLYAHPARDAVTCPTCGTEYPLADRRAWLLDQTDDVLLPVAELERAIGGVTKNTIKSWVRRGQLLAHGRTPAGAATFRVGDVRALVADRDTRRTAASA